jgi:tetratricopeptide (TPR) repeat protein
MLAFLADLGNGKAQNDRAFVSAWAVVVNKHGKADDAVAAFKRVVALTPTDHRAWASLALLQDSLKRIPEAISAYEEITRLKGVPKVDMVQYRMNLAHLYEKAGQSAKAVSQYREALRLEPQNTNALDNLKRLGG